MSDLDHRQEQQPTRPMQNDQAATNDRQQGSNAKEEEPSLAQKAMAFVDRHWGQDARAWLRQGVHELAAATVAFPGDSLHQQTPYGGLYQPPPSTVARALSEQQEDRGSVHGQGQGNAHQQDQGNASPQNRGSVHGNDQPQEQGNASPQNRGSVHGHDAANGQQQTYSLDDLRAMGREMRQQQENAPEQQHDHQQDRDHGR